MSVASAAAPEWQPVDLENAADLQAVLQVSNSARAHYGPGARAFDLDWRLGSPADAASLRAFVLRGQGASDAVGLALFSRRQRPLKFELGEIAIAQVALTRYWHLGDPYVDRELGPDAAVAAARKLLVACLATLGPRECLFLEGLPQGGPMHQALDTSGANGLSLRRLDLGAPFEHQFIDMPGSFAEYLAQLGSRSRQSVLYSQRRLLRDMEGAVRCECFETEESVERFIADASAVSRKTYQWNLLGLGLRPSDALRASLCFAARHGWLRSFILYCKDQPVAFMLGSQHDDCYYYDDVGYDPAFAKSSVGSVLQVCVLEFLFARHDRPRYFDFSTGYGEHKGRFGNASRLEANLLVMPATLANRVLVGTHRLNSRVSRFAVGLLDRAGVKDRLKSIIRRHSGHKGESR